MFERISNDNTDKRLIFFFILAYIIIFLSFYPSFYASSDEHEYVYNAYLIQSGSLVIKDKTLTPFGVFNGEGYISSYYIGKSIFLIPFNWFGWKAVFISGLVIHLVNVYLFYVILKHLQFDIKATILFLLYPAFVWNARTLGNESLILAFVLAAFYFYILEGKRNSILSGFMFGIACIVRYETLLAFMCFAVVSFLKDRRKLFYLMLGFVPFALVILFINNTYYGGWFGTGYTVASRTATEGGEKTFGGLVKYLLFGGSGMDLSNVITYLLMFSLVYPFMVAAPFFYKKDGKIEILITFIAYLLFYSHITRVSTYSILSPVTLSAHLRYFIPILGLLLITYVPFYKGALNRSHMPEKPIFWLAVGILFLGSLYGSYKHDRFLDERRTVFEQIYANTEDGSFLLGTVDDGMYVMPGVFGERRYLGIDTHKVYGIGSLEPYINNKTYVIYLRYKTQMGEHPRERWVATQRELAKSFIEEHKDSLKPVFNTTEPHYLEIYKWKE